MKFQISSGIAAIAVGTALLVPSLAQAKTTTVFDGEALSVKPASLSGWTASGEANSDPVYVTGRSGNPSTGLSPIDWQFWKKKKAVGKASGWTVGDKSPDRTTDHDTPWNGTYVRVTAYGEKDGIFRKMNVFQWTEWMNVGDRGEHHRENYTMHLKLKHGAWTVTSIDPGTDN